MASELNALRYRVKELEAENTRLKSKMQAMTLDFSNMQQEIEKLRASAPDDVSRWREEWTTRGLNGHKRNASTLAQLARAWHCWLGFACEAGAITPEESKKLWRRVWAALDAAGRLTHRSAPA